MTVARWELYVVGAPTGFFFGATGFSAGVVLPWACFAAFGVLAGAVDPLMGVSYTAGLTIFSARVVLRVFGLVSGITRIPHERE